jgi:chaperone required for assembly of F1-ATPase
MERTGGMSGWAAKRFWKEATVAEVDGGYGVTLDGRALRTPAKAFLVAPSRAVAARIATEWNAQEGKVDPAHMPWTRTANSAIDKVAHQRAEVAGMLAEYGGTDLLCYRATEPAELIARQAAEWDPLLDWAAAEFDAPLVTAAGVMHVPQPETSVLRLAAEVHALDPFHLAAFHDLVAISGSLVIALAAVRDVRPAEALWELSRLDERWQQELWGVDDEAAEVAGFKRAAFLHAQQFFAACANND